MVPIANNDPYPISMDRGYIGVYQHRLSEDFFREIQEYHDIVVRDPNNHSRLQLFSAQIYKTTAQACLKSSQILRPVNRSVDFIFRNTTTNQRTFYIKPHQPAEPPSYTPCAQREAGAVVAHHYQTVYYPSAPIVIVENTTQKDENTTQKSESTTQKSGTDKLVSALADIVIIMAAVAVGYIALKAFNRFLVSGHEELREQDQLPISYSLIQFSSLVGCCIKSVLLLPALSLGAIIGVGIGLRSALCRGAALPPPPEALIPPVQERIEGPLPPNSELPPYSEYAVDTELTLDSTNLYSFIDGFAR